MKNTTKFLRLIALITISGLAIIACGGEAGGGTEDTPGGDPPLTGSVRIDGNPWVGQTLTADTGALGGTGTISYQWERHSGSGTPTNIGTNSSTYTVQPADADSTITVTVTRSGNSGSVTSNPPVIVQDTRPALTGTVSISGNPWVGQMLSADTSSLNGSGQFSYQWKRGENEVGYNSFYTVQYEDIGYTITVTVTCEGYSDSVSSDPTTTVTLPPLSGTVSINGTAVVGLTLTANTGNLGGSGTIYYQWNKNGEAILGATNSTYIVQADDAGDIITVTVTRSDNSNSVTSAEVGPVVDKGTATLSITFAQIADSAPSITGPTLYRVSHEGPTSAILMVDNPEQYDSFDSIRWRVQNTDVTETGPSFILSAANTAYNLIGEHFVTVLVMKDGVPYNKTVSFKIEY